ncbi:hypothetical protein BT67DRAFT_14403 [Trichocladium antarcticum]|uniref:Uncharacterized protein n=1 Tax=Trichocladium antarcticum TaxID=1450529 RepID=A0AAN6UVF4_9PEZI|nr:hypothetical protein BT67DRAFT_14403 [Trichocladium antarcticum]
MTDPLAGFDTQRIRAEFTVPEPDATYRMPRRTCKWCQHTLNDNVTRLRLHLQKCAMFNPRQGSRQGPSFQLCAFREVFFHNQLHP